MHEGIHTWTKREMVLEWVQDAPISVLERGYKFKAAKELKG